jgi:peptide/nickel transport system permease protein
MTLLTVSEEADSAESRVRLADRGGLVGAFAAIWRRPGARVALIVLAVFIFLALFPSVLPLQSSSAQNLQAILKPPSWAHPFGTDELGRDIASRCVAAIRTSLTVVLAASLVGVVLGSVIGMLAGYVGGIFDSVMMRIMDVVLAFPTILLALTVSAVLGGGAINASTALAIIGIPRFARITRASVLSERERDYVMAARSAGVRGPRILFRHVLPNVGGVLIVQFGLFAAFAIIVEAALSFLGVGVKVPTPSLGSMLADGRPYFERAWWYAVAPGVTITLLIWSIGKVCEDLRDALDPGAQR